MSKYKFDLSQKIKGMVEWQLEHYHEDRRQVEQYKRDIIPSATAAASPTAGCAHGASRTTEDVAIRIATNAYVMQTERSCAAISRVIDRLPDLDKKLVDLVYWKQSYTIEGAGMRLHLGKSAAYEHVNRILGAIALEMGYVNI